jgi:hypothetical protein
MKMEQFRALSPGKLQNNSRNVIARSVLRDAAISKLLTLKTGLVSLAKTLKDLFSGLPRLHSASRKQMPAATPRS